MCYVKNLEAVEGESLYSVHLLSTREARSTRTYIQVSTWCFSMTGPCYGNSPNQVFSRTISLTDTYIYIYGTGKAKWGYVWTDTQTHKTYIHTHQLKPTTHSHSLFLPICMVQIYMYFQKRFILHTYIDICIYRYILYKYTRRNQFAPKACLKPIRWDNFFFIFSLINLFIFGCVGSSLLYVGFLQWWRAGATLCCDVQASHCGGFFVVEHGL